MESIKYASYPYFNCIYPLTTVEAAECDHFGQTKSYNTNQMIIITDCFYLVSISKWDSEK